MTAELTFTERIVELFFPRFKDRRNALERQLLTDELTDLGNRAAFNKAEPQAVKKYRAFILFDLNNFGRVNKQCGHRRGDEVLQRFAKILREIALDHQVQVFRYAGDEFIVIAPKRLAKKVRDEIEQRFLPEDFGNFTVSVSGTIGRTFEQADQLLQDRKRETKNAGR